MESQSTLYGFFEGCWKNGTVLTVEMRKAVEKGRITQAEYDEITAKERGNAYPDQEQGGEQDARNDKRAASGTATD